MKGGVSGGRGHSSPPAQASGDAMGDHSTFMCTVPSDGRSGNGATSAAVVTAYARVRPSSTWAWEDANMMRGH